MDLGQTSVNEPLFDQAVRRLQRLRAAQGELEMPDVMSNRRNSPRFALILAAVLTEIDSNTRLTARTSDVSRTGCYIDTLNPIPQGKLVNVVLTRGEETFECRGQVMYVSPGLGMGVKFDEPLDPRQSAVLNRWLEDSANLRL